MKFLNKLKVLKIKILVTTLVLLVIIAALITLGVYFKIKSVQSFMILEQQAQAAERQVEAAGEQLEALQAIDTSLGEVSEGLKNLQRELCLQRAQQDRRVECE